LNQCPGKLLKTEHFQGGQNRSCLRGENVGKGCGRVNIVHILCTHLCKWKMKPMETIPGMEEEGIKNDGGGEFKYDIL
jgi:hypothetical protein